MQDRFGTKAANLPTPSSGSEQSSSPDGIQSFKLHHRKDSDEGNLVILRSYPAACLFQMRCYLWPNQLFHSLATVLSSACWI